MPYKINDSPFGLRWHIWEKAGLSMSEYSKLPWNEKKILILKYGELPEKQKRKANRRLVWVKGV